MRRGTLVLYSTPFKKGHSESQENVDSITDTIDSLAFFSFLTGKVLNSATASPTPVQTTSSTPTVLRTLVLLKRLNTTSPSTCQQYRTGTRMTPWHIESRALMICWLLVWLVGSVMWVHLFRHRVKRKHKTQTRAEGPKAPRSVHSERSSNIYFDCLLRQDFVVQDCSKNNRQLYRWGQFMLFDVSIDLQSIEAASWDLICWFICKSIGV